MIQEQYSPKQIEASMQQQWTKDNAYRAVEHAKNANGSEKPKFYACSMLPYPSGKLHMGHVRNYTINDVMYRQLRMRGYNVLMPMGWDAFGMPAENAAIKSQVPPAQWTYENIAYMKKQMQAMGLGIDWEREIAACSPDYYRWTQWLFLKMLEKGIAYRKTQMVNWDPVDQTVLANEQVIDGRGWRSGALVEKREIPGYYLNITKYAEELLAHLPKLEGWPEKVRLMQEHWIGKSEGVRFAFPHKITNADGSLVQDGKLYVFTTRVDTIFGVTFCAVAPEHPLAQYAAKNSPAIADFIETCKKGGVTEAELATKEKEGIDTGLTVIHPLTQQAIPVWIGNYVLMSYGDGAVMGVPAHDERDFAFAQKYQLTIQPVMHLEGQTYDATQWQDWYGDKDKTVTIHSGEYSGLSHKAAVQAIAKALEAQQLGSLQTTYRLRDWGISRQRYWGTPIPMIHCADCGTVPVPEADLPVVLPENLIPDGSGNPLAKCETFLRCQCPKCGKEARRETDTMDTFLDSSWYFLRYTAADNSNAMVDERTDYWMPMDQYIGGIEHAVLHLLYARFWTKVMRDLGLIQTDEPFTNLLTQGMVLNTIYSRKNEKGAVEYFWESEIEHQYDDKHAIIGSHLKKDGTPVDRTLGTMSKSKNNGVDPQSLIDSMGADTARLFVMFASPPEQTLEWSDSGVDGSHRFLKRLWAFAYQHQARLAKGIIGTQSVVWSETDKALKLARRDIHQILQQAQFDYERMQYNTVVSAGMKLLNTLEEVARLAQLDQAHQDACLAEGFSILVRLLYPIIPHMTAHLWQSLALEPQQLNLLDATWPQVDPKALITDEIELVLQINGKLRGSLTIARDLDKASIEALACAHDAVKRHLGDAAPKRIIVVPGKLVNIVG